MYLMTVLIIVMMIYATGSRRDVSLGILTGRD